MKRRRLEPGKKVVVIYDVKLGYVQQNATFLRYDKISIKGILHETPVFAYENKEITGIDCFWIEPERIRSPEDLEYYQYQLIPVQIAAMEIANQLGYYMPTKIKDSKITQTSKQNLERVDSLIKKLGFDPRDETWLEKELAITDRERKWFRFERENGLLFTREWDEIVHQFNLKHGLQLSIEEAKNLSKKRMRYILGSFHVRMSGSSQITDWKDAAREFERFHRERENRMLSWTLSRNPNFPLVRVKKRVPFFASYYFHKCLERIPHVFTSPDCNAIREGVILRVISYDPKEKFIRLDFTPDIRREIKNNDTKEPWIKDTADYDMWLKPDEIETHLDILEPLTTN